MNIPCRNIDCPICGPVRVPERNESSSAGGEAIKLLRQMHDDWSHGTLRIPGIYISMMEDVFAQDRTAAPERNTGLKAEEKISSMANAFTRRVKLAEKFAEIEWGGRHTLESCMESGKIRMLEMARIAIEECDQSRIAPSDPEQPKSEADARVSSSMFKESPSEEWLEKHKNDAEPEVIGPPPVPPGQEEGEWKVKNERDSVLLLIAHMAFRFPEEFKPLLILIADAHNSSLREKEEQDSDFGVTEHFVKLMRGMLSNLRAYDKEFYDNHGCARLLAVLQTLPRLAAESESAGPNTRVLQTALQELRDTAAAIPEESREHSIRTTLRKIDEFTALFDATCNLSSPAPESSGAQGVSAEDETLRKENCDKPDLHKLAPPIAEERR